MRTLLTMLLPLAVACGSSEAGGLSSTAGAGDTGAGVVRDTAVHPGTTDAGAPDARAGDAGPADVGPDDAGVAGTGPEETAAADAGAEEAGPTDAGATDPGLPDTGPKDTRGELCAGYQATFAKAADQALACSSPFSCTELGPACVGCKTCEHYYSADPPGAQPVWDLSSEALGKGCPATGPGAGCVDPLRDVGVCQAGKCGHDSPSCAELETRAKAAIDEGMKCSDDGDCIFQAQSSLPCGCGAFMNIKTIGPGKPLMKYLQMLVKVYNTKKCFDGECGCPSFSKAVCEKGVCKSLP